ncbi:MAG: hypothetical protein AAF311_07040 [Pseudomonadota bacterium]
MAFRCRAHPDSLLMVRPLAPTGEGLHFARVKAAFLIVAFLLAVLVSMLAGTPAGAQTADVPQDDDSSRIIIEPPVELLPPPDLPPEAADPTPEEPSADVLPPEAPTPDIDQPDYSRLSRGEERAVRLDDMFARLAQAGDESAGQLVAEEIWALWLDSGSASVDLILRRGARAQAAGDNDLARRMFDHATQLMPGHAEGWARSSRLALEERDFARAASEAVRALTLEPRHFYALWTLGTVLERLGRQQDALDAYREANALHPTLESVAERVEALELQLDGSIL